MSTQADFLYEASKNGVDSALAKFPDAVKPEEVNLLRELTSVELEILAAIRSGADQRMVVGAGDIGIGIAAM